MPTHTDSINIFWVLRRFCFQAFNLMNIIYVRKANSSTPRKLHTFFRGFVSHGLEDSRMPEVIGQFMLVALNQRKHKKHRI